MLNVSKVLLEIKEYFETDKKINSMSSMIEHILYVSVRIPAWDQCAMQCLANWICVLQCPWSQHPYGAWNNKQLCVSRDFTCGVLSLSVCVLSLSVCLCVCGSVCVCVCVCVCEGWLRRGLLTQSIKAVWDSHWDTKGLRMWAPHKQDSKTASVRNTNMDPYFLPQPPPNHPPYTANPSISALLPQLVDCVLDLTGFADPLRRLSTPSSILQHCLSIVIHTAQHCLFMVMTDRTVWSPLYRTLHYITVNMELQSTVKSAANLNTYFSHCSQ